VIVADVGVPPELGSVTEPVGYVKVSWPPTACGIGGGLVVMVAVTFDEQPPSPHARNVKESEPDQPLVGWYVRELPDALADPWPGCDITCTPELFDTEGLKVFVVLNGVVPL